MKINGAKQIVFIQSIQHRRIERKKVAIEQQKEIINQKTEVFEKSKEEFENYKSLHQNIEHNLLASLLKKKYKKWRLRNCHRKFKKCLKS